MPTQADAMAEPTETKISYPFQEGPNCHCPKIEIRCGLSTFDCLEVFLMPDQDVGLDLGNRSVVLTRASAKAFFQACLAEMEKPYNYPDSVE